MEEVLFIIGGPQGSGLETSALVLTRAFAGLGYNVVSDREYHSNIRGRHSYTHMRVSIKKRYSLKYPVDIFVGMSAESVFTHFEDIAEKGFFVYDTNFENQLIDRIVSMEYHVKERLKRRMSELGIKEFRVRDVVGYLESKGVNVVKLNYTEYLRDLSKKYDIHPRAVSRYLSGIAIGAVAAFIDLDMNYIADGLRFRLRGREKLVEHNKYLVSRVIEDIQNMYGTPLKLKKPNPKTKEVMVLTGNEAVAIGKVLGGMRVQTYYPITPAADESLYLEQKMLLELSDKQKEGIVILQTEDELAAIGAAIGAALAGARSSTTTSGPGFSLMVEGLGWAGINEVPVVVTYYQRGGPSTGMPTRGAQSDLLFAIHAGHGEFARIVLASGDHLESILDAVDAFNFAEKFQVPVIHLLDKFVANSTATVEIPDLDAIEIDRGNIVDGDGDYKRFDKSSIISPRAFIGSKAIIWYTGSEHDEYGHVSEDPFNRIAMYEKRIKKMELIQKSVPREKKFVVFGDKSPEIVLVGWGYTKCPVVDALEELSENYRVAYIHYKMLAPFPRETREILERAKFVIGVEHSYGIQIAELVLRNLNIKVEYSIAKYTGRPIYQQEIVDAVNRIVRGEKRRVVLTYGQ